MIRRIIYIILFLFVSLDIGFSFIQHSNATLEGDIAEFVVPSGPIKRVLESPLGLPVITQQESYANPNRFFSHWIFKEYMLSVPIFLQKFTNPVDSVYLACGIAKTVIQIFLIYLLALAVSGSRNVFNMDFIIAAALITPLFQTNGYNRYMGIVDPSITHVFFYALPAGLLALYFLPLITQYYHGRPAKSSYSVLVYLIPLGLVISLSGILNPGIVLVGTGLFLLWKIRVAMLDTKAQSFLQNIQNGVREIDRNVWLYLTPICLFSLYSLYLGMYNSIHASHQISLIEMYSRLPAGIYYQFTQKLGFPVLFLILLTNGIIIWKLPRSIESKQLLNLFKWIGLFALLYIIALPLGGYREHRFNILRYDTIMPITLGLIFIFSTTTIFLIRTISKRQRLWYLPLILGVLFIFTYADEPRFKSNDCERAALINIANSTSGVVQLDNRCTVLSWEIITTAKDSELNATLLEMWNVTETKKQYYYLPN